MTRWEYEARCCKRRTPTTSPRIDPLGPSRSLFPFPSVVLFPQGRAVQLQRRLCILRGWAQGRDAEPGPQSAKTDAAGRNGARKRPQSSGPHPWWAVPPPSKVPLQLPSPTGWTVGEDGKKHFPPEACRCRTGARTLPLCTSSAGGTKPGPRLLMPATSRATAIAAVRRCNSSLTTELASGRGQSQSRRWATMPSPPTFGLSCCPLPASSG